MELELVPREKIPRTSGDQMHPLAWVGIVLVALWALLWLGLKIVSGVIHLLVVIGIALLIWGLIKRGASAVRGNP
jgi:LPXTG-motif cell wall-anchored protein